MNTRKKLKIRKVATAFFLAAFVFLASSTSALAASRSDNITSNLVDKVEDMVYPTSGSSNVKSSNTSVKSSNTNNDFISAGQKERLLDPAEIPAQKQPIIDRSDPDNNLLEKSVKAFKNAGDLAP